MDDPTYDVTRAGYFQHKLVHGDGSEVAVDVNGRYMHVVELSEQDRKLLAEAVDALWAIRDEIRQIPA